MLRWGKQMKLILIIVAVICTNILTGCAVSIFKDFRNGDKRVQGNVKEVKKWLLNKVSGLIATAFCLTFSVTFALIFLLG